MKLFLVITLLTVNVLAEVVSCVGDNKENATALLESLDDAVQTNLTLALDSIRQLAEGDVDNGNLLINSSIENIQELEQQYNDILNVLIQQAGNLQIDIKNCTDGILSEIEARHDTFIQSIEETCSINIESITVFAQNCSDALNVSALEEVEGYHLRYDQCADNDDYCFQQLSKALSYAIIDIPRNITTEENRCLSQLAFAGVSLEHCSLDPVAEYDKEIYSLLQDVDGCIYDKY